MTLLIKIGNFDFTECWDGVLYKKLSHYPDITEWEMQSIYDFINYEKRYGRLCRIETEESIAAKLDSYKEKYNAGVRIPVPTKITECTACSKYKGCMTDLVCHTSSVEDAVSIFGCGSLLSAVLARKKSAAELRAEKRNAANDPEDYFYYVMFSWGNCQAGDRLVTERRLGRFPDEKDLGADLMPGVRFFFRYDRIIKHPSAVFDGVLPLKIKDEVVLKEWVHCIIVPEIYRDIVKDHIPDELNGKVFYIKNDCTDIWEWSEKVYEFAKKIG